MTSLMPSGSGHKWTITKVHKRPEKKLYSRLPIEERTETSPGSPELINDDDDQLRFLDSDVESSSEEDLAPELLEMARLRYNSYSNISLVNHVPGTSQDSVVEREIEKGDTLQGLSIKYGCKVSELKRRNNIINDQEFYGLKTIKIPVKRHGFVEEELLKEIEQKASCKEDSSSQQQQNPNRSRLSTSPRKLRIGDSLFGENRQGGATFIQQMDTDLEKMRQSIKTRKDTLEEVTEVLTCKSIVPLEQMQFKLTSSGYYHVKTKVLLVIIIVGLLVLPIVIFLWMRYG